MKLKFIIICILCFLVLFSCKSKKKAVQKKQKKEVVVAKSKKKSTGVKKVKSYTDATIDYINKYKTIAKDEMKKHKIPASITLAQGILESSSGTSDLTMRSNNHFGIKCHKGWKGKKTYHDDDEKGECFRVYKNPDNSFRDHSDFLLTRSRYSKLFKLKSDDYEGWAKELSRAGYATDRRYPAKLIGIIEKYKLHKYDYEILGKSYKKTKRNKLPSHIVEKGDTLYSISRKYSISVDELKEINNLKDNIIIVGQYLKISK